MKNLDNKQIIKILFIISMFFTMLIGISLSYNYDFTNTLDLLFQTDTGRVINDITDFSFNHFRLNVHPLLVLFITPLYNIIKGLVINKMLSLVVLSSLVTSISVVYIYKILDLYNKDKKINILLSLCYLFSFSNYIFTAGIEIYNIAALFLIILWYYVFKNKDNLDNDKSIFIFIVLGILSAGFTITNIVVFLIVLFTLFIFKKVKISKLLIIFGGTLFILLDLVFIQNMIWHNTPGLSFKNFTSEREFTNYSININKLNNVIKEDYLHSIIANDVYVKLDTDNTNQYVIETIIDFDNNIVINIFTGIFYLLSIIFLIRNYKKNKFANTGIILTILFNTILHILYGNEYPFVYSLHFLYLFFILFGINIESEENNKIKNISKYYLIILLIIELIINNTAFMKVLKIIESILPCNYYVSVFGLAKCILFTILFLIVLYLLIKLFIKMIKRFKDTKEYDNKLIYIVIIIGLIILIHGLFIGLETSESNERVLLFKINEKYDKDKYIDKNKYIKYQDTNLRKVYKEEFKELDNYKEELKKLKKDYKVKEVSITKKDDFYLFGMGNRKKLIFKDSKLVELNTNKILYNFNIKGFVIIPNIYTVLIETVTNEFIKIYEDDKGVHININNMDLILNGTNESIDLYDFSKEKYPNILKVLYSEILFNIKDSVIYPNIFVYDSPWYRDAAITSMVLKKTNNTDLISKWVSKIDSIYDLQNKGNKEADNLGELLYILSTKENINEDLVRKIENEAESISKDNHIVGLTDYKERPLYQNLWYKLGIESIGKKFTYDISSLDDDYSNTCWWSDNIVNSNKNNLDINYPYLTIARYHKMNKGKILINKNLYPLSWEANASEANYNNLSIIDNYYVNNKISPTHTWTASELFLLLFNE